MQQFHHIVKIKKYTGINIANECLKHFFLSKTKYKRDCMSLSTDVAGKEES